MHLIQKDGIHNQYYRKLARLNNVLVLAFNDLTRFFSWYLCGGRKFYTRYYQELVQAHKWCFIVGCNNSGTSLLQKILQRSNQISTLPFEGQLYTRVFQRANKKGFARVWSEYSQELSAECSPIKVAPRLLHDWMRNLSLPIHKVIVEKTPANVLRMNWLTAAFPNSYFIGMVRNGYAVCEGIHRKAGQDLRRAACHWNKVNEIMLTQGRTLPHFLLIKYEELTEKPNLTMRRIADFLDINPCTLEYAAKKLFSFSTVIGNKPQRLKNLNQESIARLTPADLRTINSCAAHMLHYFGYKVLHA